MYFTGCCSSILFCTFWLLTRIVTEISYQSVAFIHSPMHCPGDICRLFCHCLRLRVVSSTNLISHCLEDNILFCDFSWELLCDCIFELKLSVIRPQPSVTALVWPCSCSTTAGGVQDRHQAITAACSQQHGPRASVDTLHPELHLVPVRRLEHVHILDI